MADRQCTQKHSWKSLVFIALDMQALSITLLACKFAQSGFSIGLGSHHESLCSSLQVILLASPRLQSRGLQSTALYKWVRPGSTELPRTPSMIEDQWLGLVSGWLAMLYLVWRCAYLACSQSPICIKKSPYGCWMNSTQACSMPSLLSY